MSEALSLLLAVVVGVAVGVLAYAVAWCRLSARSRIVFKDPSIGHDQYRAERQLSLVDIQAHRARKDTQP